MASPQKENGYTSIANELLEQLYRRRFSASQLKILLLVIRFTYGFNRKTATLSNTFIAAGTGMHEITVSKEVGTLLRDNVLKLYKKPSFHNSRVIGINKDYESWLNHLELAEALRVSEIFDRVSETGENELADTLTKKEKYKKDKYKEKKESALPGDDGTEFLVHPNSGELYKVVDGVMYNKRGRRLNEAGYIDIDFGLSKGGRLVMYDFKSKDVFDFAEFIGAETKQKGNELFFKYCPRCHGGGGDKETFSVNLQSGAFKCFRASCDYHGHFVELARDFGYKLDDEQQRKYRRLPQPKIESKPKAIEYLESRGISEEVARKYKITTQKHNDNILVFPFYDDQNVLQFVKYRKIDFDKRFDKNKEWCEAETMPILFGMAQCDDFTRLVITEGQIDSLSLATCGIKNAVSVPTGALGFTWLANCWDWINKFQEVVVFGDYEKGKITLIETLEKRLQMKVKCVRPQDYLCEKDANDILRKYGKEAIIHAVENAELREVKYVKRLANVEAVNLRDLPKIKTGILPLDRVCGGLLLGHVVLLSGKRGEGKSTFMSQLVAEAIDQDNAVFVYSGELPNYHFKNWLDLQIAGKNHIDTVKNEFGDDEYYLSEQTIAKINRWYYDKAFIFDNSAVSDDEFDGLIKVMVDAICRYDIKLVCIDNLMTAMDSDPNTDIYRQQSAFVKNLEKLAQQYDVAIILVAHPKKTNVAFDNDTVSGSSDITNAVSFVFNYQRANDGGGCDSYLMVTKNRMNGKLLTGDNAIPLYYSEKSKRISENPNKAKEYYCFIDRNEIDKIDNELPL